MADEIFGLEPHKPLPDGWTPLEAVTVVKCLDSHGEVSICIRYTEGVSEWEGAGMLLAAMDRFREWIGDGFEAPDPDEDGQGDG